MYLIDQQSEPELISTCMNRKRPRSLISRTDSNSSTLPEPKKRRVSPITITQVEEKAVRFSASVVILPETSSTTSNEWYNDQDAARFQSNIKRDVMYLAKLCQTKGAAKQQTDVSEYCSIGLERYCCTGATRQAMKTQKTRRVRAVLDTQYAQRQLHNGAVCAMALRHVAEPLSQAARDKATAQAARLVKMISS